MSEAKYPGIRGTHDGSEAVAWTETHVTTGAAAYPITPSSDMGALYEAEYANGKINLWGQKLTFIEPESEHSSASACEGYALAGGRITNFTCGQGLILMKEVLYTIAGKRLPVVFNIAARSMTVHSLSIHAGHDDIMGVSDTGWGMLIARNAQETGDLSLIARRAAEDSKTPFFNVMDGFLTTHTVQDLMKNDPEFMKEFVGDPAEKLFDLTDPALAIQSGPVQNQDSYMKGKIAQRSFTELAKPALADAFKVFGENTGRKYDFVLQDHMEDAEYAIVAMGTTAETAIATADYLRKEKGMKVGVVSIMCFRPFPAFEIVEALKNVKAFAIIERMDNPLAQDNPLTIEIKSAFADAIEGAPGFNKIERMPRIYSGAAGLSSRDVRPGHIWGVYDEMMKGREKRFFVLGINYKDEIPEIADPDLRAPGSFSMRGHSVGGFGSVTTNKVIATIVSNMFNMHVQAYPMYGSEKKGLPTKYFLTVSPEAIKTHCELTHVDFVPMNDVNAFNSSDPLQGLTEGGILFMQSSKTEPAEIWAEIPEKARKRIKDNGVRVLALDSVKIAEELAPIVELVQRMQGIVLLGVFLKATPFAANKGLSHDELFVGVKDALTKYFGKRGEKVIQSNLQCVERGYNEVIEIPKEIIQA